MQSSRAPVNPWSYYPTSMDAIACFLPWSLPAVNSWCRSALNTAFLSFILSPFLLSVCLFSLEMPTHLWLQLLAHQQPPCLGDCWGPGSSQFLESAQMATLRTFPGSYLKLPLPSQLPQHFLSCVPFYSLCHSLSHNVLIHLLLVCISTNNKFQEGREFHLCCYIFSI